MTLAIAVWAIFGIAIALSAQLAYERLWIMAIVPVLLWVVAGVVLLGLQAWSARRAGQRRPAVRRAAIIVVAFLLFYPFTWLGGELTERIRFAWKRATYDRIVAQVQTGHGDTPPSADTPYDVDPGPPIRVAFTWPGGLVDNWCGIVHDPSGEVMKVNELPLWSNEWRHSSVTRLFGGDMTSCRVVDSPYYMCCFT